VRGEICIGRGRIHPVNGRIFGNSVIPGVYECNDGHFPRRKAPSRAGDSCRRGSGAPDHSGGHTNYNRRHTWAGIEGATSVKATLKDSIIQHKGSKNYLREPRVS
jgi:hypothetical protein